MSFLQYIYSLWPLIFLFSWLIPIRRDLPWISRVQIWLNRVLTAWFIWAILGIFLLVNDAQSSLIPEPLNTILFLVTGLTLVTIRAAPSIKQALAKHRLISQTRKIEDLFLLSPRQFENLIAAYFQQYGFQVEPVGRSGDHGVDLIVITDDGEKWVVQCKRWKGSVGEPVVRDLYGAMHHEGASRAFLMTTGLFTPSAYAWVEGKPITLYDGAGLVRLLRRVQRRNIL